MTFPVVALLEVETKKINKTLITGGAGCKSAAPPIFNKTKIKHMIC